MIRALRNRGISGWAVPFAALAGLLCAAVVSRAGSAQDAPPAAAAAGPVVAVVDMSRVLRESSQWQDMIEEKNRTLDEGQQVLSKLIREMQVLRNDHDNLPPGSEERQRKAAEIQQALAELERTRRQVEAEAARQYNDATRAILTGVGRVTGEYAREHGIDLVLRRQDLESAGQGTQDLQLIAAADVLYANPDLDISEAVIAKLNAAYQAPIQVE